MKQGNMAQGMNGREYRIGISRQRKKKNKQRQTALRVEINASSRQEEGESGGYVKNWKGAEKILKERRTAPSI